MWKVMDNAKPFGLIVNKNAGKVVSKAYKREIFEDFFKRFGIIHETRSLDDVSLALKDFQLHNVQILFIYGGDGTHQKVISTILRSEMTFPYIVPLKGGTMNMLVKDLNLGMPSYKVMSKIVDMYYRFDGNIPHFKKPYISVVKKSENKIRYGFYFANGVIYNILKRYYEQPSSVMNALRVTIGGLLGSILSSHSFSKEFLPLNCTVIQDGEILPQKTFLGMMAGTLNRVVFGMKPFAKTSNEIDHFHYIAYAFHKLSLLIYFPFLSLGYTFNHSKIFPSTPKTLILQCDSGYVLDGELYHIHEKDEITIQVGGYLNIPIIN